MREGEKHYDKRTRTPQDQQCKAKAEYSFIPVDVARTARVFTRLCLRMKQKSATVSIDKPLYTIPSARMEKKNNQNGFPSSARTHAVYSFGFPADIPLSLLPLP